MTRHTPVAEVVISGLTLVRGKDVGAKERKRFHERVVPKPGFIIATTLFLAIILFASALVEYYLSRKDIMNVLSEEAATLTHAIAVSSDNATLAYSEIEEMTTRRLLGAARLIERLARDRRLGRDELDAMAADNGLHRIHVIDEDGEGVTGYDGTGQGMGPKKNDLLAAIQPLLTGEEDEVIIGFKEGRWSGREHYAVAVKRSGGGAIVVSADADEMLRLRREIGIGRLIDDVVRSDDVLYVVVQDTAGIIAASKNVSEMSRIENDAFLMRLLDTRELDTRLTEYQDETVFEAASSFYIGEQPAGILRVGLASNYIDEVYERMGRRLIVTSAALLVIGVIVFGYLVVNQNYRLLDEEFERTSTYAGNILENMADGVVCVDRDGRITIFNRAAESMFEVDERQALGTGCTEVIPMGEEVVASLWTRKDVSYREETYHLGGRRRIFAFTSTVISDRGGRADSVVTVIRDLTEHRMLEENLKRTEKLTAMGELASGVAHEIRNPLNAISMIAQRLAKEFEPARDSEEFKKLTSTVVGESRRLNDIIQRFLKFARPPSIQPAETDLRDLLREVVDLMMTQAEAQNVTLMISGGSQGTAVLDRDQMKQVLLNLLQNSLHATPSGGNITVGSAVEGDRSIITVTDSGVGIPPEDVDRIFDLYYTTREEGTGMGLSIANQIVAVHGGHIELESEPGRGTIFRIILPRTGARA